MKTTKWIVLLLAWAIFHNEGFSQSRMVSREEAVQSALLNNAGIRASALDINVQQQLKRTALEIPKTQALFMYGQYNSLNKDNNITITQSIPFPTVFTSQSKLGVLHIQSSEYKHASSENELVFQVKQVYETLRYLNARQNLLLRQDSIFADMVRITALQYATGEATLLQKTSADTRYNEVQNLIRQNEADLLTYGSQLRVLINSPQDVVVSSESFLPLTTTLVGDSNQVSGNPLLSYQRTLKAIALQEKRVESNKALPDLTFGYFNQTLTGFQQQLDGSDRYFSSNDRFSGFMVGMAIPIWFVPAHARVRAASIRSSSAALHEEYVTKQLYSEWEKAVQQFAKHQNSLNYYHSSALPNAKLILRQSSLAYRAGDISQADYRLNLQQALSIEEAYVQTVLMYNQSIITLEFLSGKYSKN
jgi:cobalt-zinc-cadmium resistance protein CzcA